MKQTVLLLLITLVATFSVTAQRVKPADEAELKEITNRGRLLAEYDVAAWHSTDAVMAMNPEKGGVSGYIARKTGNAWTVVYGRLNQSKDKFLIVFEAIQQTSPTEFKVQRFEKPKEDRDFFLNAARAFETTKAVFSPAENRPYNAAILPENDGRFLVYFVPAQTQTGIFPIGGDTRYTVSKDGSKILSTRQMHKSIIEFQVPPDAKPQTGYHTAILDDVPEDTDVFHVLAREPKIPELIVTQKFVYRVEVDGTVLFLMTTDAFKKIGQNKK